MAQLLPANRLGECDVQTAAAALATLLAHSCHSPSLDHPSRMAAHASLMRLIAFASTEVANRKRRAHRRRMAANQAYDAYLADRYAAEQLGEALQLERLSDLLYGERDFTEA